MTRMRVLFLCHTLPYPPDGGVSIRSFNLLRLLAGSFEVQALCFYRAKGGRATDGFQADLEGLREYAPVEAFPIPQQGSPMRLGWDHIRSLSLGRVYTRYVYRSSQFRSHLAELLRRVRFDLVHVDSLDLSEYMPLVTGTPVVCGHHNIESELLERRALVEPRIWRRGYLRLQAKLMAREESLWCPKVALNVLVSSIDETTLRRRIPEASTYIVPNGVDTTFFRPEARPEEGLAFAGGLTWWPNRDALDYFTEEILPLLRGAGFRGSVRWIGRATDLDRRVVKQRHDIDLTGYVTDVRPHIQRAACYVVPLRVGGGTRLKILDAWAMGKAVVSTSVGCEGLEASDGQNILIRDTPESFAQGVLSVLKDEGLRRHLSDNARKTAVSVYDWSAIGERMTAQYRLTARA